MQQATRFLGLDVHADTIAAAYADEGRDGELESLGVIANEPGAVRRLVQKLGSKRLRACYEAGPTGYTLYWQLAELGIPCDVVAYVEWIRAQRFEHGAQQATLVDYLSEVDHASERIKRLEAAIDDAVQQASPTVKASSTGYGRSGASRS